MERLMNEAQLAWSTLTVFLAFAGFGGVVWGIANWVTKNSAAHRRIIELLEEMQEVEQTLDDVLKHPDDTNFSFKPIKSELEEIRRKLVSLETTLSRLVKYEEKRNG